jgi:hypothetical protein
LLFQTQGPKPHPGFQYLRSQIETLLFHTKGPTPIPGLSRLGVPDRNSAVSHQRPDTHSRTFQTKDPKSKHCFSTRKVRNRIPDFPDVRSQIEAVLFHTKGSKPIPGLSKLGIPDRNTAFPHQGSQTESRAFSDRSPAFPQCRGANLSPSRGSVIGVHITVTASCSLIFKSHEAHHVGSVGCEHGSPTPTAWSGTTLKTPQLRGPDRSPLSPHQGSQTETRASNTKGPGSKPSFPTMSRGKPQNIKTMSGGSPCANLYNMHLTTHARNVTHACTEAVNQPSRELGAYIQSFTGACVRVFKICVVCSKRLRGGVLSDKNGGPTRFYPLWAFI